MQKRNRCGLSQGLMWDFLMRGRLAGAAMVGLLMWVLLGQGVATGAGAATEAVKGTVNEVISILEDEAWSKPERAEERRRVLEKIIGARFDYEEMSKRSLGRQWRKLNDSEKQEFVQLFTALLARSYADKIEGYSGEQVEYINQRTKGNFAEVKTRVVSGKVDIPLDYRLLNRSGDWRVYDVVVDGVSLVRNYRGQFSKVIKSSSYEDLVKKLRDKTEKKSAP